jgi:uncharacterized membrane protein
MMTFTDIFTTVCIGLMIGTEFAVSVFVNPVLWRLEDGAQVAAIRMFARKLGTAMPFWYVLSQLLLVVETLLRRHEAAFPLLVAAVAIWAVVIVLTLHLLVPINNRMMRLEPGGFAEAARQEHHRWDSMHRLRVAALTAAMVCFLLAVLR